MGRKLTIPYYRPLFVEKTPGDVGSATPYPIEVTLDQVAEIWYRVKTARYTGGAIQFNWTSGMTGRTRTVYSPPVLPASGDPLVSYAGLLRRGYQTRVIDGGSEIPASFLPYLGASYTVGGDDYRDIADDELGTHLQSGAGILPEWNLDGRGLVNAFSYYGANNEIGIVPSEHLFYSEDTGTILEGAVAEASFSGEVGVVKASPELDMLDPSNQFYLGFRFNGYDLTFLLSFGFDTEPSDMTSPVECCNYVIRLSSGDVSCPIYGDALGFTDFDPSASTDIIHEPLEWWPYAKPDPDNPGSTLPVWNTITGAKL